MTNREITDRELSELFSSSDRGDPVAFERLVALVYPELKRVARGQLARLRPSESLKTTELVHETYLKLVDRTQVAWESRGHFLAIMARAMRQVLIDFARERTRFKRGGGERPVTFDEEQASFERDADELLALDRALQRLGSSQPRLLRVVECRYFAGYTGAETAEALGVSRRTVLRDWLEAKALLREILER